MSAVRDYVETASAGAGRRFFLPWVTILIAIAWGYGLGAASQSASEPFSLGVRETAEVEELGLSLTFTGVTGDSRCPRDVTCIVAGEAVVVLQAQLAGETTELTFRVPPGGGDEQELDGLTIAIVALEPEAVSTQRIDPDDYVATITVTEARENEAAKTQTCRDAKRE